MSKGWFARIGWRNAALGLVFAVPLAAAAAGFYDGFDLPGSRLDTTRWTTEMGPASFLGRTQLQDWVSPGGIGQFVVSGGQAQLALETYNPTGFSLYGTHGETLTSFAPDADTAYALSVRMRLQTLQPGLVFGVYFYGCASGPCATHHDELDIEILTNFLQPGQPLRVQLNRYADEPLGAGQGPVVGLPAGFDPLGDHAWTIFWMSDRVTYYVDGTELFSATDHVPQGAMRANLIAWGPAPEWPDAYSGALQPTANPALNQRYVSTVDYVVITAVPELPAWPLLVAGLGVVGVASRRGSDERRQGGRGP